MTLVKLTVYRFSILCDVFLVLLSVVFMTMFRTAVIMAGVMSVNASEENRTVQMSFNQSESDTFKLSKRFDIYNDFSKIPYDTIHRILRDEETVYRNDEQRIQRRWKKSTSREHNITKRSTSETVNSSNNNHTTSSNNSTKWIELGNRNLTQFVFDSDLVLSTQQSILSEVTHINLTNNRLTEFSTEYLSRLNNLETVDLSYNNITNFLLTNTSIVHLNLTSNKMFNFTTTLPNAKLKMLSLSNNNISSARNLNLTQLNALEILDLSCNEIQQVSRKFFGHGRQIKRLNLSRNRLMGIYKEPFYNLLNTDTLILSYNNISTIDYETFLVLPNLQYLDLSYNNIQVESIRALQGIPDLVGLSIAYNPDLGDSLQEFVASWSLKELDASGTGLCQIPSALAQSVRTLKLVDNWFEIIRCGDLDSYPLLQYLDLSSSHISDIEDDALGRLEILQTLFLDHNNLKHIPISLPTSLEHLFLHNNQIMDIQPQTLQQLSNLRTLDLSRNKLTYIPGLPLPKLVILNLQFSELRGLSQSVVKTSPKLRDLLLDGNPIKCTELLGIAEWASPCQNERITEIKDVKRNFIQTHNYMQGFHATHHCPKHYNNNRMEYRDKPLCARKNMQSNKLESQIQTSNNANNSRKLHLDYTNALKGPEDIENSIQRQQTIPSQRLYDNQSKIALVVNALPGNNPAITSHRIVVPNEQGADIKVNDGSFATTANSKKTKKSRSKNKDINKAGSQDARTEIISSQNNSSRSNSTENISAKTKKFTKLKQHQTQGQDPSQSKAIPDYNYMEPSALMSQDIEKKTTTILPKTSKPIRDLKVNRTDNILNTTKPKETNGPHEDKLDLTVEKLETFTLPSPTLSRIPIESDSADKIKTTKGIETETTNGQHITTIYPNNRITVDIVSASLPPLTPPTTRPSSKMMSSKVNKADKVEQPSAIYENGIIKRNQSATLSLGQHYQQQPVGKLTKSDGELTEPVMQKRPKLRTVLLQGKRYNQESQQKHIQANQTISRITTIPAASTTTPPPTTTTTTITKNSKVKPDKHLKFIGEKNLNLTVLTYSKGHTHRTINKDNHPNLRRFEDQIFLARTVTTVDSIDIAATSTTTYNPFSHQTMKHSFDNDQQYFRGDNHFKVNTELNTVPSNRILSHNNNNNNNETALSLTALQSHHHPPSNISKNSSTTTTTTNGLPPEQWLDIRTATGHPGLFIVIGVTFGMLFTLGLIHIYRCRQPWNHHSHHHHHSHNSSTHNHLRHYNSTTNSNASYTDEDSYYIEVDQEIQSPGRRRDFLPMELLSSSVPPCTENHLDIW